MLTPHARLRIGRVWVDALTFDQALVEIEKLVDRGDRRSGLHAQCRSRRQGGIERGVQERLRPRELVAGRWHAARLGLVPSRVPLAGARRRLGHSPASPEARGTTEVAGVSSRWRPGRGRGVFAAADGGDGHHGRWVGRCADRERWFGSEQGARWRVLSRQSPTWSSWRLALRNRSSGFTVRWTRWDPRSRLAWGRPWTSWSGSTSRAPAWMGRYGLEWLYRLSQEPRRLWRRYLVEAPRFLGIVFSTWRLPTLGPCSAEFGCECQGSDFHQQVSRTGSKMSPAGLKSQIPER